MRGKRKCDDISSKPSIPYDARVYGDLDGDFGNVTLRQQCTRQWMQNPATSYDDNIFFNGFGGVGGPIVLDFESFGVSWPSAEEGLGNILGSYKRPQFLPDDRYDWLFRESSVAAASRRIPYCDMNAFPYSRKKGQVVLDFESSSVLMSSADTGIESHTTVHNSSFVFGQYNQQSTAVDTGIESHTTAHNSSFMSGQYNQQSTAVDTGIESHTTAHNSSFMSGQYNQQSRAVGQRMLGQTAVTDDTGFGNASSRDEREPPEYIKLLFGDHNFLDHIRVYNQMFSMTSFGARVDESINNGRGPYVFKISGQIYHWIGTLCPFVGDPPRNARDKCYGQQIPDFKIRLYKVVGAREYDLPTSETLGAIVFKSGQNTETDYDPGFHTEMKLRIPGKAKRLSMNMYYMYQLHERFDSYGLLFRAGRLFQQYVVGVYCYIEQNRTDYYRQHQADIRKDYLSGIYDAISKGDREGYEIGSRIILPTSFTGGPRYMYSHYLDALAICRVLGNPQYFISFTYNVNWPEIKRHMEQYPRLLPEDRADVVVRVFEQKVHDFCKYFRDTKLFGIVTGLLYTIEFQNRGLPYCHTLLWVDNKDKIQDAKDVDRYISAKLPDPKTDPEGYRIISEMMVHGPCGKADASASCMKENLCSKKFPKKTNNETYFDKNGYVYYHRRDTGVEVTRRGMDLDNSYVVPYNRQLCIAFHAHINVEYCGWSMLIKYLFKYISKGTDKTVAHITRPVGSSVEHVDRKEIHVDEI
nr:DNA helicase [Tanacetum cinerariifolium]